MQFHYYRVLTNHFHFAVRYKAEHCGSIVAYPDRTAFFGDYFRVGGHAPRTQQHPALKRRWKPPTQYWRRDSGV